jgi:ABC-type dipeptide/oligopeptide/nickel transport system ATPase component
MAELLNVKGLETHFRTREGIVHAVNGVSFNLKVRAAVVSRSLSCQYCD